MELPPAEQQREKGFRPLSGDLISQWYLTNLQRFVRYAVSVPFPGILFLNLLISIGWKLRQVAGVSVLFPGILFLNELIKKYPEGVTMFPSPFLGSYFSIF